MPLPNQSYTKDDFDVLVHLFEPIYEHLHSLIISMNFYYHM